ncbi:MAG: metallophosphoesterase [Chloroflexaceae bacterium]|nr:metallophosphoesterase [Chloroflexaceae bacterium]
MRYTLMHISDLHVSWHFDLTVAEQLVRQAHDIQPDLLVISGDFVLRADLTGQLMAAAAYLKLLPGPQLVVPGNHDVSLFNGYYRLFYPLRRYRRFISPELNPVFARPGLTVVGGCTAHGLTIDGGRLHAPQIRTLDYALSRADPGGCRVLVLHHHVVDPPSSKRRPKIANAADALHLMNRHRVELFLCGHTHVSYVGTTNGFQPGPHQDTIISQCGTTTSRRGRGHDRGKNSFHLVDIDDQTIQITPYFYQPDARQFLPASAHAFPRRR